jgi:hypothetical protein
MDEDPRHADRDHMAPPAAMSVAIRIAAVLCVAGVAVAAAGCGDEGGRDPRVGVLDRAAAADAPFGVRYRFRSSQADGKETFRARGYGQAEADQRRSRVVLVARDIRGETILDGDDEYGGGDFGMAAALLETRRELRWTKLDRSKLLDAGYIDKVCGAELPAKLAGLLAKTDPAVERLGAARVGDRATVRYRVTTTRGRVLDELAGNDDDAAQCERRDRAAKLVATLWIDRDDLVRRVRVRYRGADGLTVETRDITGYDRDVRVTVPGGPAVGDITDTMLRLVDSICKSSDAC